MRHDCRLKWQYCGSVLSSDTPISFRCGSAAAAAPPLGSTATPRRQPRAVCRLLRNVHVIQSTSRQFRRTAMNDDAVDQVSTQPDGEQKQPNATTYVSTERNSGPHDAPSYEHAGRTMRESRSPLACKFTEQILRTSEPFRLKPVKRGLAKNCPTPETWSCKKSTMSE